MLPKISFFTWEAAWGKILTLDRLRGGGGGGGLYVSR